MKVKLISYTPEPDKVVAAAGRLCYSSLDATEIFDEFTPKNTSKMIEKIDKERAYIANGTR